MLRCMSFKYSSISPSYPDRLPGFLPKYIQPKTKLQQKSGKEWFHLTLRLWGLNLYQPMMIRQAILESITVYHKQ